MTISTVAFLGLGNMGAAMAARLVAAGFSVRGHDPVESSRLALTAAGGHPADTLADALEGADAVILMLPDSTVVTAVVRDAQFTLPPETVVVDMSSSEPLRTRELAAELAERDIVLADAPVSGGVSGAKAGTLTIMIGGDDATAARIAPIMDPLGSSTHVGAVGAGHAVKSLNNLMSASHLLATSEAMLIGERFGLDQQVMLDVVNGSSGRSWSTQSKWPNFVVNQAFDSGFGLRLMLKDIRIALDLGDQVGAPGSLSRDVMTLWSRAADALPPSADHTEIARWVREAAVQS